MKVSVLILTKNEERDLPGCIASAKRITDDIHVYDSMSTDKTVEIAKSAGCKVTQRSFDNWASHQNWGLTNISFENHWVFYIDADERLSDELIYQIQTLSEDDLTNAAFRIPRRDYFMGTWLKHTQTTSLYMRLFRPELMRYERLVNPVSIPSGPVMDLQGHINHFPFSKGISHWIERHNSYSTLEATQIIENLKTKDPLSIKNALFHQDFSVRRFHQKELFYRTPFRPILKFFLLYVVKRGFLDGRAGLAYASLQAIYEYFIVLKTRELSGEPPPCPSH